MLFLNKYNFRNAYLLAIILIFPVLIWIRYFGYNIWVGQLKYRQNVRFCNGTEYEMLPGYSVIDDMDETALYLTFQRYINQKQIICTVSRAGPDNPFGKNICADNLQKKCLVYSFGSKFHFEFETAIYKSHKCEIHTFDPSLSVKGKTIPEGVNFHLMGLSNKDESISTPENFYFTSEKIWKLRTLSTIRNSLQHFNRVIDILKIDVDGWEWPAFPQMLQSGVLKNVKQICLEVEFGHSFRNDRIAGYKFNKEMWGNVTMNNQLKTLKKLHDYGFRIFMSEPDKKWAIWPLQKPKRNIYTLVEISLVNINVD